MRGESRLQLGVLFACAFALSSASAQPFPRGAGPSGPDPDDVETFPDRPPKASLWLFYDPSAPDSEAVRDRAREAARKRGYGVREFELSRQAFVNMLAAAKLSRGLRGSGRQELFVGELHLTGVRQILRFLDGWQSGAEEVREPDPTIPPPRPMLEVPVPPTETPEYPAARTPTGNVVIGLVPEKGAEPPAGGQRVWASRDHITILAALALAVLLVLSIWRSRNRRGLS